MDSLCLPMLLALMIPMIGPAAVESGDFEADVGSAMPGWQLVWADEFDRPGPPDPQRWAYETGGRIRNNERQVYTDDPKNVRVEDGTLILEAHREIRRSRVNRRVRRRGSYTSASLMTVDGSAIRYGRVEVRAQLPSGRGLWPAIWMLGTTYGEVGWPRCGEIDIMEYVGFKPDTIHANVHCAKYNHIRGNGKGNQIVVPAPENDFHIYAVEWFEDRIDFFVDDQQYFTYEDEGTGPEAWPFDTPQTLKMNIAVGGDWGGQQGIDDAVFPQRMVIDYVRVYRRDGSSTGSSSGNAP